MAFIISSEVPPFSIIQAFDPELESACIGFLADGFQLWTVKTTLKADQICCLARLRLVREITDHAHDSLFATIEAANEGEF